MKNWPPVFEIDAISSTPKGLFYHVPFAEVPNTAIRDFGIIDLNDFCSPEFLEIQAQNYKGMMDAQIYSASNSRDKEERALRGAWAESLYEVIEVADRHPLEMYDYVGFDGTGNVEIKSINSDKHENWIRSAVENELMRLVNKNKTPAKSRPQLYTDVVFIGVSLKTETAKWMANYKITA